MGRLPSNLFADHISLTVSDPETSLSEAIRESVLFCFWKIARLSINKTKLELLSLNVPSKMQAKIETKTNSIVNSQAIRPLASFEKLILNLTELFF